MKGTTYYAVFEPTSTGFSVYFPDILGCVTTGKKLLDANANAKEALELHLWGMEKDKEPIPKPTTPPFKNEELSEGSFIVPITVFMDLVKNEMKNKAVKKTLTIPYWLNQEAEQQGVNFSLVLQTALKEVLNTK